MIREDVKGWVGSTVYLHVYHQQNDEGALIVCCGLGCSEIKD